MAMVKKSITVTEHQESWIQAQMSTGNYATDSEIIREAIRDKQAKDAESEWLRAKLREGEHSGFFIPERDKMLAEFKEELRREGKL